MDIFSSARNRSIKLKARLQSSTLSQSNTADFGSLYWTFNPNNHRSSARLTEMVYSTRMLSIIGISIILYFLLLFGPYGVFCGYSIFTGLCLWIPYMAALMLSMNTDALGFIIKSSEYWIKIAYSVVVGILNVALIYHRIEQQENKASAYIEYTGEAVTFVINVMLMAAVGSADAIPRMHFKWKVFLFGLVAFVYSCWAIGLYLLFGSSNDYVIEIEATGSVVSCRSLLANSYGTLALFMWKAVIDVMRKRDRCASITYSPYLRWEVPGDDSERSEPEIPVIRQAPTVVIESSN